MNETNKIDARKSTSLLSKNGLRKDYSNSINF